MITAKARPWGNSLGIVIPKKVVDTLHLHSGEELLITVEKKENPLKELFGFGKHKITREAFLENRKLLESKYL